MFSYLDPYAVPDSKAFAVHIIALGQNELENLRKGLAQELLKTAVTTTDHQKK
jgi:hypothetical protein